MALLVNWTLVLHRPIAL